MERENMINYLCKSKKFPRHFCKAFDVNRRITEKKALRLYCFRENSPWTSYKMNDKEKEKEKERLGFLEK